MKDKKTEDCFNLLKNSINVDTSNISKHSSFYTLVIHYNFKDDFF
jgi:hypothetical protein